MIGVAASIVAADLAPVRTQAIPKPENRVPSPLIHHAFRLPRYTCCVPVLKSLWVRTAGGTVRIGRISNALPILRKVTRSTVTYH